MTGLNPRIAQTAEPRRSRSLEYGVAILESFRADRPALRISELADIVGISRSTSHRYASTLVELGQLEQDSKRRYRLAHNAARAGLAAVNTVRLEIPARAILEDLRAETGHTVSMALLDGTRAVYVHRLRAHGRGQFEADGNLSVGAHVPAHTKTVGLALLSSLLDSELQNMLADLRPQDAEPTTSPVETSLLLEEIERVRRAGIAVGDDGHRTGARSIAAPLIGQPLLLSEWFPSVGGCSCPTEGSVNPQTAQHT
jgi:IclR family transcriptional regulator, pca regulon regulatory protein